VVAGIGDVDPVALGINRDGTRTVELLIATALAPPQIEEVEIRSRGRCPGARNGDGDNPATTRGGATRLGTIANPLGQVTSGDPPHPMTRGLPPGWAEEPPRAP
jgi:hypothetical protein